MCWPTDFWKAWSIKLPAVKSYQSTPLSHKWPLFEFVLYLLLFITWWFKSLSWWFTLYLDGLSLYPDGISLHTDGILYLSLRLISLYILMVSPLHKFPWGFLQYLYLDGFSLYLDDLSLSWWFLYIYILIVGPSNTCKWDSLSIFMVSNTIYLPYASFNLYPWIVFYLDSFSLYSDGLHLHCMIFPLYPLSLYLYISSFRILPRLFTAGQLIDHTSLWEPFSK